MSFSELLKANGDSAMGRTVSLKPKPKIFKRKELTYDSRILLLKDYYSDVKAEYTEANIPTNLYNMFEEILSVISKEDLIMCETIGLFKNALEDTIGKEEAKSKNKVYI